MNLSDELIGSMGRYIDAHGVVRFINKYAVSDPRSFLDGFDDSEEGEPEMSENGTNGNGSNGRGNWKGLDDFMRANRDKLSEEDAQELIDEHEKQEFTKSDAGKSRMDLVPPKSLLEVGDVLAFGAKKYKPNNWREVDDRGRYSAAAMRHLLAYQAGEDIDKESGLPHLAHAICCLMFLRECDIDDLGEDTRPK